MWLEDFKWYKSIHSLHGMNLYFTSNVLLCSHWISLESNQLILWQLNLIRDWLWRSSINYPPAKHMQVYAWITDGVQVWSYMMIFAAANIQTSGWPKNQKKCWYKTESPPHAVLTHDDVVTNQITNSNVWIWISGESLTQLMYLCRFSYLLLGGLISSGYDASTCAPADKCNIHRVTIKAFNGERWQVKIKDIRVEMMDTKIWHQVIAPIHWSHSQYHRMDSNLWLSGYQYNGSIASKTSTGRHMCAYGKT